MSEVLSYIPVPDDFPVPEGMTASWVFITHKDLPRNVYATYPKHFTPLDEEKLKTAYKLYRDTVTAHRIAYTPLTYLRWQERLAVKFVIYVDKLQTRFRSFFGSQGFSRFTKRGNFRT